MLLQVHLVQLAFRDDNAPVTAAFYEIIETSECSYGIYEIIVVYLKEIKKYNCSIGLLLENGLKNYDESYDCGLSSKNYVDVFSSNLVQFHVDLSLLIQ